MKWVNGSEFFPPDWDHKHLRYAIDHVKIDTDLFDIVDGALQKIGAPTIEDHNNKLSVQKGIDAIAVKRPGRLEFSEIEWLDDQDDHIDRDYPRDWRPMHSINKLERGDIIRHKTGGDSYLVDYLGGDFAIAIKTKHISNPHEWEVFK